MEIKHEHIEMALLTWAAEVGQDNAANAIAKEYVLNGGTQLRLVAEGCWNNQQNIYQRWLKGETELQREKIRLLLPAILRVLPRDIRHRLSIYDTIERRALLAAQHAIGTAIDAHDDAIEAVYSQAYQPGAVEVPKYH
ncbi:toxin YdaT family protein [Raoultella terrigena]|uniref:toxin YdaT family protein n=1 Tax=Raoultella terrigena TaxID=577 RepID=UPI0025B0CD05|nr:toxin YdaT family protein [Raoultella terrigena]WJV37342.1 toxin YdaT family protein [Raoultella terrigena]